MWCRRLWWEGIRIFHKNCPLLLWPLPRHLQSLLLQWLAPGLLRVDGTWPAFPPTMTVYTDSSYHGEVYHTDTDIQGRVQWSGEDRQKPTNMRELLVSLLLLLQQTHLAHMHVCFHMDGVVAVHCVRRMGSSRSLPQPGPQSGCSPWLPQFLTVPSASSQSFQCMAGALSGTSTSSVEWSPHQDCLQDLQELFGEPEVDFFASTSSHLLPSFLTSIA